MAEKKYVGRGWGKKFKGGYALNLSLRLADLKGLPVTEHGDIRLVAGKRRAPDEKSKADWWVAVDDWYYENKAGKAKPEPEEDEMPF